MEEYLRQFKIFNENEIQQFVNLGQPKKILKNEFFIKEGAICKKVGFVISGIFRTFYYSNLGDEVTYCFTFSNNLLSAYSSFITGTGTPENIQAITDCELLLFSKEDFEALVKTNPKWLLFSKIIAEQQYIEMEKRVFTLQKEKAEVRYLNLLKEHPEYLQEIPLQYIASFLGITQRHLSRIRKELTN